MKNFCNKQLITPHTFRALSVFVVALGIVLCVVATLATGGVYVGISRVQAAEDTFQVSQVVGVPDTTAPSAPTSLSATAVSTSQINLTWTASTDDVAVSSYKIYRDTVFIGSSGTTSYSDTGLTANTTYAYTVRAVDSSSNESLHSATSSATTFALEEDEEESVSGTPASGGLGGLTRLVLFYFNTTPGQTQANISFGTNIPVVATIQWGLTSDFEAGSLTTGLYAREHDLVLTDLTPNTTYQFRVTLVDGRGRTLVIENQTLRTLGIPDFAIENVSNLVAISAPERITLTWKNPRSPFDRIRVVRSDRFYPHDPFAGDVVYEGRAQSFVDTNVVADTTYYYGVFTLRAGEFSSGAVASAALLKPGERSTVKDFFAGIVELSKDLIHPILNQFSVRDIDFFQDGVKLPVVDGAVDIRGDRNIKVSVDYHKVPEILKTIAVTMYDPEDNSKSFSFLLRVNKDKTAYEALIAPLERPGRYTFGLAILDHKNQGLKKVAGVIVSRLPEITNIPVDSFSSDQALKAFSIFAGFLIVLGLAFLVVSRRRKHVVMATLLILTIVSSTFALVPPGRASAAFNGQINYQGKLLNASSAAVADGTYHMRFKLYTTATGGSEIWSEDRSTAAGDRVTVTNGLFSVMLGSSTPLTSVNFNQTLYLGVEIGGSSGTASWDGEMTPRKVLGAVPAAFETDKIDGLSSEQFLRSDAVNSTSTATTFLTVTQNGAGRIADFIGPSSANVLSILSGGNIGIGTTTPNNKLDIYSTTKSAIGFSGASGSTYKWTIGMDVSNGGRFSIASSTALGTLDRFVIDGNGNVGIGTTSPYAKLSVDGRGVFNQDVRADYFTATSTTATSTFAYDVSVTGRLKVLESGTLATIVGDVTGNARGTSAVDIQASHGAATRVASGENSVAVGNFLTASGQRATNIGYFNEATHLSSVAIGDTNSAGGIATVTIGNDLHAFVDYAIQVGVGGTLSGERCIGIGYEANAVGADTDFCSIVGDTSTVSTGQYSSIFGSQNSISGSYGTIVGYGNTISAEDASIFGAGITNNVASSTMIGPSDAAKITILGTSTAVGYVGIGTTSPYAKLSVDGRGVFNQDVRANYFTATSTTVASTFPYASTTALTVSGSLGLSLGSLNGPLQANNGQVSATTSVGVLYGGTGLTSAPAFGNILVGNASGSYTLTATTSLGLISSLGAQFSTAQTGSTQTFATSSDTNIHLTITSSGNVHTFTPSWNGTLAVARGGTGVGTFGGTNTLLYTTSADTLASITTGNSSILVTNGSGVPAWSTTLPAHTLGGDITGASQAITGLARITTTSAGAVSSFAGAVGVGTTTPFSMLSVSTSTASDALTRLFTVASSTHSTLFTVLGNGNVGIGTSTPFATLSVVASTTDTVVAFRQATSSNSGTLLSFYSGNKEFGDLRGLNISLKATLTDSRFVGVEGSQVVGRYLYTTSNTNRTFTITDVYDPANPKIVGSIASTTAFNGLEDLYVAGKYAYVGEESGNDFSIIDVSDPTDPRIVSKIGDATRLNSIEDIYVTGRYAYVTAESGDRFTVIDVSNPSAPVIVSSFTDTRLDAIEGLHVVGRYAYVSSETADRFSIIDVSNPTDPFIVGSVQDSTNLDGASGLYVSGRYAYVVSEFGNRLTIVDIATSSAPSVVGSVQSATLMGAPDNLAVSGKYAYVTGRTTNSLTIVDVSSSTNPVIVDSFTSSTYINQPVSISISGRYAYLPSFSSLGVISVIDIGGLDVPSVRTGSVYTGTLETGENLHVGNNLIVAGGANVGTGGLLVNGPSSFWNFATSSLSSVPTLSLNLSDGNSSSVVDVLSLTHNSSSTASNNIGTGLLFGAEDASTFSTSTARIASILTNTSITTPTSVLTFSTKNTTGSLTEWMRLDENGNLGLGTTTPYAKLSVVGQAVAAYFTATTSSASTLPYASTTALTVSGSLGLSLGSLNGPLQANNGQVSATTTIGVLYGGLGLTSAPAYGQIPVGNSSGGYTLTATSSLGITGGTPNSKWATSTDTNAIIPTNAFKVGIGTSTPLSVLSVSASSSDALTRLFTIASSTNTTLLTVLGNGNVGIGTTSPFTTLSVSGNAQFTGSATSTNLGLTSTSNQVVFRYGSSLTTTVTDSVSASSKTITLPNITGTLASLAGTQTFTGTKTFSSGAMNMTGSTGFNLVFADTGVAEGYQIGYDATGNEFYFERISDTMRPFSADEDTGQIGIGDATNVTSVYLDATAGIGIASSSPWRKLSVDGTVAFNGLTSSATGNAVCITTKKDITDAGAGTCTPSSERFKENIQTLAGGLALDTLGRLRVVSFDYREGSYGPEDGPQSIGLIAEEVEGVDRRLVDYGHDGRPMTLHFERITGLLVQSTQELKTAMDNILAVNERQDLDILNLQNQLAQAISGGAVGSGLSLDGFLSSLQNLGIFISDTLAKFKNLAADTFTVGSPEKPTGITLYDSATGQPYCLKIENGVPSSVSGRCEDQVNPHYVPPVSEPQPNPEPNPEPEPQPEPAPPANELEKESSGETVETGEGSAPVVEPASQPVSEPTPSPADPAPSLP